MFVPSPNATKRLIHEWLPVTIVNDIRISLAHNYTTLSDINVHDEDCYVRQNGEVHSDYHVPHDTGTSPAKETQTVSAWKAWNDLNQLYKKCESEREQIASEKDATEREMRRTIEDLGKQLALTQNELNRVNDSQTVQKNESNKIREYCS